MKKHDLILLIFVMTVYHIASVIERHQYKETFTEQIEQSKEHHLHYHELIKKNHQLNDWYQNHDCDVSYEPCSVSVECKKYEL